MSIPSILENKTYSAVLGAINSHIYYGKSWRDRAGKVGKVGNDQLGGE